MYFIRTLPKSDGSHSILLWNSTTNYTVPRKRVGLHEANWVSQERPVILRKTCPAFIYLRQLLMTIPWILRPKDCLNKRVVQQKSWFKSKDVGNFIERFPTSKFLDLVQDIPIIPAPTHRIQSTTAWTSYHHSPKRIRRKLIGKKNEPLCCNGTLKGI